MQRIEFSELTNRLHRNTIATAAVIIGFRFFDIKIKKVETYGIEFINLTTGVIVTCLVVVLLYHAMAFALRAFEEYRYWRLHLPTKQSLFWSGGTGNIDLANLMQEAAGALKKIAASGPTGEKPFTKEDAEKLHKASEGAMIYAKHFKNFPMISGLIFWGWDIGFTALATLIAVLYAISLLPNAGSLQAMIEKL